MSNYLTDADLAKLYRATFDGRSKWRYILLALDISSATIDRISVQWSNNPDDCYREGLSEWLKGGDRSWEYVVKALSSPTVGHSDIARTIERDHLQSTDQTIPSNYADESDEGKHQLYQKISLRKKCSYRYV